MVTPIESWMQGYVAAWASNRAEEVLALFTDDAEYRSYPWATPERGGEAILAFWRRTADAPDDHGFSWEPLGADGPRHFVQGRTTYADGRIYENLWVVDLAADGRATGFTEWYMSSSEPPGPNA